MTYRAAFPIRESLLDLSGFVIKAHAGAGPGGGQYLAIALNESGFCASVTNFRNPAMDGRRIVEIGQTGARETRQGGKLFEAGFLCLVSHSTPGVQISSGQNNKDEGEDGKVRSPKEIQVQ
jgi:hypothetical protein